MNIKALLLIPAAVAMQFASQAQKTFVDGSPLVVLDATSKTINDTIGHTGNFDGMHITTDGQKLFAYNETLKRLYIADVATNNLLDSVTFTSFVFDFLPGPGNTVYYSENPTDRVYKMDLATKMVVDSSAVLTASGAAVFSPRPGTNDIWLTIGHEIHSFTTSSMSLMAIPGGVPSSQYIQGGITFDSTGGKAYYFSKAMGQVGKLYQMDATTKVKIDSLETPDVLGGLKALTLSGDDTTMYIAYWGLWPNEPSKIYIGHSGSMQLTDSVAVPHKPFNMVERPNTNELWVVYHYDAMIGILDRTNNLASLDSIDVGTSPKNILFAPVPNNVTEVKATKALTIYPNPSTGLFRIEASQLPAGATYSVTDMTGREIAKGNFGTSAVINLGNQNAGIYILRMQNGESVQYTNLVKQ